jgi:hypothetical protein
MFVAPKSWAGLFLRLISGQHNCNLCMCLGCTVQHVVKHFPQGRDFDGAYMKESNELLHGR